MKQLLASAWMWVVIGWFAQTAFAQTAFAQTAFAQARDHDSTTPTELTILRRLDSNADGWLAVDEIPVDVRRFVANLIDSYAAEDSVDKPTKRIDLKKLTQIVVEKLEHQNQPSPVKTELSNQQCIQYAKQLISNYDVDKSESLEATEFSRLSDKWIECDLNQDLQLDAVEVAIGLKLSFKFPGSDDEKEESRFQSALKDLRAANLKWQQQQLESRELPETNDDADHSRQFAETMISNYDANRNGTLEAKELAAIGEAWKEVDFDRDGKATIDEVQVRFQAIERERKKEMKRPRQAATANRPPASDNPDLPDEFRKLDADKDGQVEMHEFATEFDSTVIRDFYERDINQDGVITKNEWLRSMANRNRTAPDQNEAPQKK